MRKTLSVMNLSLPGSLNFLIFRVLYLDIFKKYILYIVCGYNFKQCYFHLVRIMPALFIDMLDLWLMILGGTLLVSIYWLFLIFKGEDAKEAKKSVGLIYLVTGLYAFFIGLWAAVTWPLPSSYNIIFSDIWPIFGIALLALGAANYYDLQLFPVSIGIAMFSIPVLVYGVSICVYKLTREPVLAGLMFIVIALAGLLSPLTLKTRNKGLIYLTIILLLIGAVLAFFMGISASFEHISGWRSWFPWYGKVGT